MALYDSRIVLFRRCRSEALGQEQDGARTANRICLLHNLQMRYVLKAVRPHHEVHFPQDITESALATMTAFTYNFDPTILPIQPGAMLNT